jgi:hypothetical protein
MYIINDMGTVIGVVHHVIVEKTGVLGCCAVLFGDVSNKRADFIS